MLKVARFGKLFITLQPRNDSKMKTILTRRTIRKYADPIEEDIIMIGELAKFDEIVKSGEIIDVVEKVVKLK